MKLNLTLYQTRVLGVLIEKEITTPDQYPLSINALVNGCNQKSSRDPVLQLDESTVQDTVDELKAMHFTREDSGGYGSRVVKLKHRFCNTEFSDLKFTEQELGIICVLFLRGPQSPGELRTRTNRLCSFTDNNEVEATLNALAARNEPLVIQLNRETGKRDARWAHLFSGEVDVGTVVPTSSPSPRVDSGQDQRITDLEQQVKWLKEQLELVKSELGIE